MQYQSRELWLNAAVIELTPLLEAQGAPLPKIQVSCGFPKSRGRQHSIGQCFRPEWTQDGTTHLFICPTLGEDVPRLLDVLLHELVHAGVGCEEGHKGRFKSVASALGLEGKMTATIVTPGSALHRELCEIAGRLGPYPHAVMTRPALDGEKRPASGGWVKLYSSSDPKYILRVSPKALEAHGPPLDPWGDVMTEEQPG